MGYRSFLAYATDRQRRKRFREDARALVNAPVRWADPSGHYYIGIWDNNLTDHRYRLHYPGTENGNGSYSPMVQPLTCGITLGYKM